MPPLVSSGLPEVDFEAEGRTTGTFKCSGKIDHYLSGLLCKPIGFNPQVDFAGRSSPMGGRPPAAEGGEGTVPI